MANITEHIFYLKTVPIYLFFIGIEVIASFIHRNNFYSLKDTIATLYLTLIYFIVDITIRGLGIQMLGYFYQFENFEIENVFLYWIFLFLAQDFWGWVMHYSEHNVRLLWAGHITHHSSEKFNLTTSIRASVWQPLYRFVFFIPLTLVGFHYLDILLMYSISQIYGIYLHTQYIKKLGVLEYFLVTPSHHRVHHGSNICYLDKNMGVVLIIWDRLFRTFQKEDTKEPVQFGLLNKKNDKGPVNIILHEMNDIIKDVRQSVPLSIKLKYIFYAPGWSHNGRTQAACRLRKMINKNMEKK